MVIIREIEPHEIRTMRRQHKLTQAGLAELIAGNLDGARTNQATVARWETGKSQPAGPARHILLRLMGELSAEEPLRNHDYPPSGRDARKMKTLPDDVLERIETALPELAPLITRYRAAKPTDVAGMERQIALGIPPGRGLEIFPIPLEWNAICKMMRGEPYSFRPRNGEN